MLIRAFIPLLTFSILLWGCAGSQKTIEKKAETQEKNLVNASSPAADSLVSKLPRFAYLFFKDIVDSLPNEYYYSTKNNVIDSLFKKENEHYELVATIHFDSTQNKKNDYILQKKNWVWMVSNEIPKRSFEGNVLIKPNTNEFECSRDCITRIYNEEGRLTQEFLFPKYLKTFSDSGKLESEISGILYKANTFKNNDAQDSIVFKVEDGEEKTYYEFGILKTWAEIKNRKSIAQKKWNENGVVTLDYKLPKYLKTFYDNGNLKEEYSGTLYRGTDTIRVENGTKTRYYENGNIQAQMEIKNRKKTSEKRWYESGNLEYEYFYEHQKWAETGKVWNEQGVLIKEFKAPDFYREFYANGKLKQELTGISSKSPTEFIVNNGISKFYYENGKIQNQIEYKDYKKVSEDTWYESGRHESSVTFDSSELIVAEKKWNEKGLMTKDLKFPDYLKQFNDNGKLEKELKGILRRNPNNMNEFLIERGTAKTLSKNGKIILAVENDTSFSQKTWSTSGKLLQEANHHKVVFYWNNGKIGHELIGNICRDSTNDSIFHTKGTFKQKEFYENGIIKKTLNSEKHAYSLKEWNEKGVIVKDVQIGNMPNEYKEYQDNGKIKLKLSGILYMENNIFFVENGESKLYYENGNIQEQDIYENRIITSHKQWNEKGVLVEMISYNSSADVVTEQQWNDSGMLIKDYQIYDHLQVFYDNGKLEKDITGLLYKNKEGTFFIKDGVEKYYYKTGQPQIIKKHLDNKTIYAKEWNETGRVLIEYDKTKKYFKLYQKNGRPSIIFNGEFQFDFKNGFLPQNGVEKTFFNDGKQQSYAIYKENKIIEGKRWNENGTLILDHSFPKYSKSFFDNGKLKTDYTGLLYYDDNGKLESIDGYQRTYAEDGSLAYSSQYKNKILIQASYRKENIYLEVQWDTSGSFATNYKLWMDGILIMENFGIMDKNFNVVFGKRNKFYTKGKKKSIDIYRGGMLLRHQQWNEQGFLTKDIQLPNYYRAYYQDGKLMQEAKGTLVEIAEDTYKVKDGFSIIFATDGDIRHSATYKDFQLQSKKK